MNTSRFNLLLAACACAITAVVVYLPALAGEFVWDDANALRQSHEIRSLYDVIIPPPAIPKFYYRPVVFLSYIIDSSLGGTQPYWFHVSSIVLHALNTLLVLLLAWRWFPNDIIVAAGGALLFAVFPTHVESVAWVSGRSDLIMTTFLLSAALLHLRAHPAAMWLGAVALLLASLAKETAVAAVVLFPLLDWAEGRRPQLARLLPPVVAVAAYFALRQAGVGAFLGGLPQEESAAYLGLEVLRALGFYIRQAFAPVSLQPYYAYVPGNFIYLIIGLLAPLAAVTTIWQLQRSSTDAKLRVAIICLVFWFFLTLFPTLYVIVRRSALNLLADRYLYAPSVASCIGIAWLIRAAAGRISGRTAGVVAMCTAALFFAAQTVSYVPVWADDVSLWADAAAREPDAALPRRELATALLVRGHVDEAEDAFRAALERTPDVEGQVMIYSNLGNLYRRKSQYALAVDSFRKGIAITPHPALFHNLGMAEMALAERASIAGEPALTAAHVRAARDAFQQALRIGKVQGAGEAFFQWEPAKTHALLGQVLFSFGDRAGAQRHLEIALQLEPTGPVADMTRQYIQNVMK